MESPGQPDQTQTAQPPPPKPKHPSGNFFKAIGRALRAAAVNLRHAAASAYKSGKDRVRHYGWKELSRWGEIVVLIALGIYLGGLMERQHVWLQERYRVTQGIHDLSRLLSGRKPYDKHTTVVLVEDEEFWGTELARRSPLNRAYLARLIKSLDRFEPRVIALDVYLSAPRPDGPAVEFPNYAEETCELFGSIWEVGARRSIVLLKSLGFKDGFYIYESDVYDENIFTGKEVSRGYVQFEHDYRVIPLSVLLQDGTQVYSFSEAIANAYDMNGSLLDFDDGSDESVTYGEFLTPEKINKYSATQVMNAPPDSKEFGDIAKKIKGKIVIIGGSWHQRSYGRGFKVDEHNTPVGNMPGVFMHANYVEALLDTRYYHPIPETFLVAFEALLGFITAILIAQHFRLVWKILGIIALVLLLVLFAVISLQILGAFFDFFIPVVMVIGHALYEQVNDWRKTAGAYTQSRHKP